MPSITPHEHGAFAMGARVRSLRGGHRPTPIQGPALRTSSMRFPSPICAWYRSSIKRTPGRSSVLTSVECVLRLAERHAGVVDVEVEVLQAEHDAASLAEI